MCSSAANAGLNVLGDKLFAGQMSKAKAMAKFSFTFWNAAKREGMMTSFHSATHRVANNILALSGQYAAGSYKAYVADAAWTDASRGELSVVDFIPSSLVALRFTKRTSPANGGSDEWPENFF